jgi:hypothetical protein
MQVHGNNDNTIVRAIKALWLIILLL